MFQTFPKNLLRTFPKKFWLMNSAISVITMGIVIFTMMKTAEATHMENDWSTYFYLVLNILFFPLTWAMILVLLSFIGINFKTFSSDIANYRYKDTKAKLFAKGYEQLGNSFYFVGRQGAIKTSLELDRKANTIKKELLLMKIVFKCFFLLFILCGSFF